jgi:folate-binding protein YgfZ
MSVQWIPLLTARSFAVSGKDARRYLHNRLSQDIKNLPVGSVVQAAALSAQGRVEGFFSVQCTAEDRFILIADGGDKDALRAILTKYIVADRVTVEELVPPCLLLHIGLEPAKVSQLQLEQQAVVCAFSRCRVESFGTDLLINTAQADEFIRGCRELLGDPLSDVDYYRLRWKMGVPVFPDELNEQVILTECGMKEAVSFTKGCYVGQEVIERSDAIGKLPRALERIVFQGHTILGVGSAVVGQGAEVLGKIVSSVVDSAEGRVYAFAMLRTGKYSAGEAVTCADIAGEVVAQKGKNHELTSD